MFMAIEGITLYRTDWSWDSLLVNQVTQKFNGSKNLQHQQILFFSIYEILGERGCRKCLNFFFSLLKYLKIILNASEISFNNLLLKVLSTKGWHNSSLFKIHQNFPHSSSPQHSLCFSKNSCKSPVKLFKRLSCQQAVSIIMLLFKPWHGLGYGTWSNSNSWM